MTDLNQIREEIRDKKAILVDVREPEEWEAEHFIGARLLPLSEIDEKGSPDDLPQDKTIYLHCRKGGRAEMAAKILKEKYPNVVALKTSFDAIKQAYFPTQKNS